MSDPSFAQGLVGVTLDDRYRLDAVIGEGGMGAVFRATQLAMDRKVAVKLLKPHLTSDHTALQRFAREARMTRKVESPHAVEILDFGVTPLGDYYMVLEYLDGRTVQRELDIDGAFAPARVAHIARQALGALGVAHEYGLVHRDVKPDNLLLMRAGADADYTKILDFGVAKLMQGAAAEQLALTANGMVFGTPEFMSPEQACGLPLDGRSDLYSLAATMFVMLTGQGVFEGNSAIEWLTHHARTPPPRLAMVNPALAAYPALDDLLQRCLAKQRDDRPTTAGEMAAMIARVEPSLSAPAPGAAAVTAAQPALNVLASSPTPPGQPRELRGPSSGARAFSSSSYFRALQATDLASSEVAGASDTLAGAASSAELLPPGKRSRRGLYLGLAGVALVGLVGVALGVSLHRSRGDAAASITAPPSASASGSLTPPKPQPRAVADVPGDAAIAVAPAPDAAVAANAVATPAIRPPTPVAPAHPALPALPAHNAEADEHLRNAEDAAHGDNLLRQLAEADLALRADPHSVRAKFLLADALIKSGDLDRGCAYLHALRGLTAARTLAHAASCPGD